MIVNEGRADRAVRGAAAAASLIAAFAAGASTPAGIALVLVAVIMSGTAATGSCPAYRIAGLRTNKPARNAEARRSSLVRH